MTEWVEHVFPNLRNTAWSEESPRTSEYNCFACAAGETHRWWEPTRAPYAYWPPGLPRVLTLGNFVRAYQTLGYEPDHDDRHEPGYEKVAIYVNEYGRPKHAAKQNEYGAWISKLGDFEDIEHETLQGLEGSDYGHVAQILKRPLRGSGG